MRVTSACTQIHKCNDLCVAVLVIIIAFFDLIRCPIIPSWGSISVFACVQVCLHVCLHSHIGALAFMCALVLLSLIHI